MTNMVISLQLNVTELELAVVDQGVGLILAQVSFSIFELRISSSVKSIFKFCLKLKTQNTKTNKCFSHRLASISFNFDTRK